MSNKRVPKARQSGLVVQKSQDELLVFDIRSNKAHCLNGTMAAVWTACDGTRTISEIADGFDGDVDAGTCEDVVWLAIDELQKNHLLEGRFDPAPMTQSRREMIRKIGLAAAVAVPVIATLAAPSSALAAVSCSCINTFPDCGGSCPPTCNTGIGVCV